MKLCVIALATSMLIACSSPSTTMVTDTTSSTLRQRNTASLDHIDLRNAANQAVEHMLADPLLLKKCEGEGQSCVVAIGSIINDTTQDIDITQLSKLMRVSMRRSGRFITTLSLGVGKEDVLIDDDVSNELRSSQEINQKSVAAKGQVIAPNFSLSGKISERFITLDNKHTQCEYTFSWALTDFTTRLQFWEGESQIAFSTRSRSVNW